MVPPEPSPPEADEGNLHIDGADDIPVDSAPDSDSGDGRSEVDSDEARVKRGEVRLDRAGCLQSVVPFCREIFQEKEQTGQNIHARLLVSEGIDLFLDRGNDAFWGGGEDKLYTRRRTVTNAILRDLWDQIIAA